MQINFYENKQSANRVIRSLCPSGTKHTKPKLAVLSTYPNLTAYQAYLIKGTLFIKD